MSNKLTLSQFSFQFYGHGHYLVVYTTKTGREYKTVISDMTIIDNTKNSDSPKQKDLKDLAFICRNK